MTLRPWMSRTHPNFFLIYTATAVAHVWFGVVSLVDPSRFDNPGLAFVNDLARPEVWGVGSLVVAVLLIQGMWNPSFSLARLGLAIGLVGSLLRFALTLRSDVSGAGPAVWFLVAALHLSQTMEPPYNPATGG